MIPKNILSSRNFCFLKSFLLGYFRLKFRHVYIYFKFFFNQIKGLFERLQMKDTLLNLCIQSGHRLKALNAVMDAREELLIQYLGNCYLRLDQEEESLKRKCSKVCFFMQ